MQQRVIITVDSTCDLPKCIRDRLNLDLIPLITIKDDQSYTDGVDIFPADIFTYYTQSGKLCKTSAPAIGDYHAMFEKWTRLGYSVVHISISSLLSASYSNAVNAAEEFSNVYIIDSLNLSSGIGLLIMKASDLAASGLSGEAVAEAVRECTSKVKASFVLNALDFLWKGGRCSGLAALGANLLKLKPCIAVKNGMLELDHKFRGKLDAVITEYVDYSLNNADGEIDTDRIFLTSTIGYDPDILLSVKKQLEAFADFKEIIVNNAGCTISCHCGPDTLGILFMLK